MKSIRIVILALALSLFSGMTFAAANLTGQIMSNYKTQFDNRGIANWTPVNQAYGSLAKCEAAKQALIDAEYLPTSALSGATLTKVVMLSCSTR